MQNNEKKQMIAQCYHCGNKGLMNVVHIEKVKFGGIYENDYGEIEHEFEERFLWKILSCPVCQFVSIHQTYSNDAMVSQCGNYYDEEIIYPNIKMKMSNVPKDIEAAFESALKIKNIDSAICLISLRRTLELICNDKGAKGKNLYDKIKYLIQEKIFPKELKEAYYIIKDFGNDGAHGGLVSLSNLEVDELIKLLYDIINYLYIMPNKINNMKTKLDLKKNSSKEVTYE